MSSVYRNVFSVEDAEYLTTLPEVLAAKASLDARTSGLVYLSVAITESIRATLESRFGVQIPVGASIPMRWIKGDTAPHIDTGTSAFDHTYLVYLNDSPGEFSVDAQSYPIQANTGFVFNEGVFHETQGTEDVPRLLLGPMNEFAEPVGITVGYYPTEADALAYTNLLGVGASFTVGDGGPFGGYTSWRLASNSTGTSPQNVIYVNGDVLISDGSYNLYPAAPCFLEGSTILCEVDGVERYVPVEQLTKGMQVKTRLNGYKPVVLVGKGTIQNPGTDERLEQRLYRCSPSRYPELTEDLYITGCHSILEYPITEQQKEDTIKHLGRLFVTDKKYRLMACVDERAEPWNSQGTYTIWHFALEHEDESMNYGVYANGGLLVETCCIRTLKNKSNMTFIA
jgi:hypothetical protein